MLQETNMSKEKVFYHKHQMMECVDPRNCTGCFIKSCSNLRHQFVPIAEISVSYCIVVVLANEKFKIKLVKISSEIV